MKPPLAKFREKPVPASADLLAVKQGYRQSVAIDFSCLLAQEDCLDVRQVGIAGNNHYNSPYNPPYFERIPGSIAELYVRKSVAAKLSGVNTRLASLGLELYVFDAWRPQSVQRHFHDVWFPAWLSQRRPDLTGASLSSEVEKYWAAPSSGINSPAPHATGGAVDLTLIFSATRQPLFMGGIFDDLTEHAWTDAFEQRPVVSMSDEEARSNRRLLYWAMAEAGFANNPTEWWHYSWGDQLWARLKDQPAAHYGACQPAGLSDV